MAEREIDPTTNLPVLPTPYVWHVTIYQASEYSEEKELRVSIREPLPPKWYSKNRFRETAYRIVRLSTDVKVWRNGYYHYNPVDPKYYPNHILNQAMKLYDEYEVQLMEAELYRRADEAQKKYSGYYPPKRLEK